MRRSFGLGGLSVRARGRAPIEFLEPRLFLAVHPFKALQAVSHLNPRLIEFRDAVLAEGRDLRQAASEQLLSVDDQQRVSVTVRAQNVAAATRVLSRVGFESTASHPELHFVEGNLPLAAFDAVKRVSGTGRFGIQPNYAPIVSVGSTTSQADTVMEADRVRATLPAQYSGAGQKIGVLSDSYNTKNGAAAAIASGDLPAAGVSVIQESPFNDTDEGRAMLELIHDLAPNASLYFATANNGEGGFASNIQALANQGVKTIVDDIIYFAEPMFQDGVIAQAIDAVSAQGVAYFSAAGNQATRAYESTSFSTTSQTITLANNTLLTGQFYNFAPGDQRQSITIPANSQLTLSFQWDNPFYTANGVKTDLDLYLVDSNNKVVATADTNNIFFQDPVEVLSYSTGSQAKTVSLMIQHAAGAAPGRIKYVNYGSGSITFNEYATNSPTVTPHAAAAGGQGVGAIFYLTQDQPESFTSKGPATILFNPIGSVISPPVTRNAPQLAGIDGTNTTFFGSSDYEADGFKNFYGTSAAAPHVAAVAALVRQANPSFTPEQIYQRLQNTADDITATGVGFDAFTGYGLVNAYDAIYPTNTPASLNFSDGFESGVLPVSYETRSTGPGRIRVTNSGTPATGTKHLVLDTMRTITSGGANVYGLNEVTLHFNATATFGTKTLSFREKEFTDEDNVMPTTFTGSTIGDGVSFSVDGNSWFTLISLTGANSTGTYTLRSFDLTAAATAAGVALGADTRIRFQQNDNSPITTDGIAFDDIAITNSTPTGAISGKVFRDFDSDGVFDAGETTFSGATVYLDADNDGVLDAGESSTTTNGSGDYSFNSLPNGTYNVKEVPPAGFASTNSHAINITTGQSFTGVHLTNRPIGAITFTTSGGNADNYLLRNRADGTAYEILIGGSLVHVIPTSSVTSFTFDLSGGDDLLTVDYVNGNPVPISGFVKYDGGANAAGDTDTLIVNGSPSPDVFRIYNAEAQNPSEPGFDPRPIILDDLTSTAMTVESVLVNGNAGSDLLNTGESLGTSVTYDGGTEDDSLEFSSTSGNDTVAVDFSSMSDGVTSINFSNLDSMNVSTLGGADMVIASGVPVSTTLALGDGDDSVQLNSALAGVTIYGGFGNDTLTTASAATNSQTIIFVGDSDTDSVTYNATNNDDTIDLASNATITRLGFSGSLSLQLTESLTINGMTGVDSMTAESESPTLTSVTLDGDLGDDTFAVTPSQIALFRVIGGDPTISPGDTLNIVPDGATQDGAIFASSEPGFDEIAYTDRQPVRFREIETVGSGIEFAPTIGSLDSTPEPVITNGNITLIAVGVADDNGGDLDVSFYLESNGTPGLQIGSDTALGSDNTSPYSQGVVAAGIPGQAVYYALAVDPTSRSSNIVSTTSNVVVPVTADVQDISPDPRTSAVDSINITFSRAVSGFDLADLTLTRDGGANLLTGAETLQTSDNITFTLGGLTGLTDTTGSYELKLTQAGSGITDTLTDSDLAGDAADAWVHDLPAWLAPDSNVVWKIGTHALTINGLATIVADPGADAPVITANGATASLLIDPPSDLVIHIHSLTLTGSANAMLASLGAMRTASNHRVLVTQTLSIDSTSALDLTDNDLIVDHDAGGQTPDVEADIRRAFNGGDWLGAGGVFSSIARNDASFHLGVADNALLESPFGSAQGGLPFAGVDVDDSSVLVKFTHRADFNLDGVVTEDDAILLNTNFENGSAAHWSIGDLSMDGVFTEDDAILLGTYFDDTLLQV